jgi:predicted DNA-binding protein
MADDEQETNEMTILAVRIPTELRERIRDAAKREERTESSFARYYLGKAAEEIETQNAQTTNA